MHATAVAAKLAARNERAALAPSFPSRDPGFALAHLRAAARSLRERRLALGGPAARRKTGFTRRRICPRRMAEPIRDFADDRTVAATTGRARVLFAGLEIEFA
jgi:hypothetical protein